jgi:GTP:adenosylcobinamide-phosphate guanylyltransferase
MEQHVGRDQGVQAIVLAGSRPGRDRLAEAAGVATKALVPIAGRPMLDHVVRTLVEHPRIAQVVLMAQQPEALLDAPQTEWMRDHPAIALRASGAGISQSLLDWVEGEERGVPVLVTTADNVLLTAPMIDSFLSGAGAADVAAALVGRDLLLAAYPESRRTWLKFAGGAWSGANLFWFGSPRAARVLAKWREIEQDRKKGWKIVSAFGLALLLGAALRLLTVQQAIARAGRRLGVDARIVALPFAEACIDADKPEDIALIERILARRPHPVASAATDS